MYFTKERLGCRVIPKPFPFAPLLERLPARKPLTFIIGIKCTNGLLLAADSLEGDGVTRKYVDKLEVCQKPDWGLCWGGSGHSRLIDKFSQGLRESIGRLNTYKRSKIESAIEKHLTIIRKRYRGNIGIVAG